MSQPPATPDELLPASATPSPEHAPEGSCRRSSSTKQPCAVAACCWKWMGCAGHTLRGLLRKKPSVAVIRLSGVLSARRSRGCLSLEAIRNHIEEALQYPNLKALALCINSPGGAPGQSELIARYIRQHALQKNIPVVAFVEDVAASGGYWLACAADEIYALPTSLIGSIGVIASGFGLHKAISKLGIERRVYTQGKHKSILDPFQPEKPEDVDLIQQIQQRIQQAFISWIKERRGSKLKDRETPLFEGDIWTGEDALLHGLIDGLGTLESVMKARFGEHIVFKRYGDKRSLLDKLGITSSLRNPLEQAVQQLEASLTDLSYWRQIP